MVKTLREAGVGMVVGFGVRRSPLVLWQPLLVKVLQNQILLVKKIWFLLFLILNFGIKSPRKNTSLENHFGGFLQILDFGIQIRKEK